MSNHLNQIVKKYILNQSFVESSFFTKLSELKLEKYKLDSSYIAIHGFQTHPTKLNKFNDTPVLNLDQSSFDDTLNDLRINIPGELFNVNTIEEFKSLDKLKLLNTWGQNVYLEVTNATSFDYKLFNKFYILTYSDLKKYKFYYWVAYPTLSNTWTVESESQETDTTITQLVETELDNEYG